MMWETIYIRNGSGVVLYFDVAQGTRHIICRVFDDLIGNHKTPYCNTILNHVQTAQVQSMKAVKRWCKGYVVKQIQITSRCSVNIEIEKKKWGKDEAR